MSYFSKSLIHDPKFDRDCEEMFGSLEKADQELAELMFSIGHNLVVGSRIIDGVSSYHHSLTNCVVVVEELHDKSLLLRACISFRDPVLYKVSSSVLSLQRQSGIK